MLPRGQRLRTWYNLAWANLGSGMLGVLQDPTSSNWIHLWQRHPPLHWFQKGGATTGGVNSVWNLMNGLKVHIYTHMRPVWGHLEVKLSLPPPSSTPPFWNKWPLLIDIEGGYNSVFNPMPDAYLKRSVAKMYKNCKKHITVFVTIGKVPNWWFQIILNGFQTS